MWPRVQLRHLGVGGVAEGAAEVLGVEGVAEGAAGSGRCGEGAAGSGRCGEGAAEVGGVAEGAVASQARPTSASYFSTPQIHTFEPLKSTTPSEADSAE